MRSKLENEGGLLLEKIISLLDFKKIYYELRGNNIKIPLKQNNFVLKHLKASLLSAGFSIRKPTGKDDFILLLDSGGSHVATLVREQTLVLHSPYEKETLALELINALKS